MAQLDSKIEELNGFTIEYRLAPNMVIFSHGFGVMRDSRGMFTEIVANFPSDTGYVLFEYNDIQSGMTRVTAIAEQAKRLQMVIDWTRQQPSTRKLAVIGHSRGCIVIAFAKLRGLQRVILLAPPLAVSHSRQYFTSKPGATRTGNDWYIPRADGTTTIMPNSIFDEHEQLDPERLILDYAHSLSLKVVAAGADDVLRDQDYRRIQEVPSITLTMVEGADHNFTGDSRLKMITEVKGYLEEAFAA